MNHRDINNLRQLANYLRCNVSYLEKAVSNEYSVIEYGNNKSNPVQIINSENLENINVEKFHIKKKGKKGGFRTVYSVFSFELSSILKVLNTNLTDIFEPKDCVHGYIKNKSNRTNALPHLAKKVVLSIDIMNFFDSISKEMVEEGLINIGFKKKIANYISSLTTTNGYLVQGFNTSPILSNIITEKMDEELMTLCDGTINYTRFSDDLYFSSNTITPNIKSIEEIISAHGFSLNNDKTKFMKRGHFQFVTGLTVFDDSFPRISKRKKRSLRLEIFYIKKFGYQNHAIRRLKKKGIMGPIRLISREIFNEIEETRNRLFGWIYYMRPIEPLVAEKLYNILIKARKYKPKNYNF